MFKVRTKKFLRTFILCVLSVVTVIHPVSAISETTLRHFAENNIIFYDPDADSTKCVPKNNSETYNSTKPSSNEITWIGDSYSVGAKSLINKKFGGDVDFGIGKSDPYIQVGKFVNKDSDQGGPSGINILKGIIERNELKPYLVFALGTNGGWTQKDMDALLKLIDKDTTVILVNSKTPKDTYESGNKLLEETANSHDNIYLADWVSVYKEDFFDSDKEKIHPNSNGGYEAWVNAIYNAFPGGAATTLSGDTRKVKVWNYFVNAGINGVSDNPAAISGILGNIDVEDGKYNPFQQQHSGGQYYGLIQWSKEYNSEFISRMENTFGNLWFTGYDEPAIDEDIITQALEMELDYLTKEYTGFTSGFLSNIDKVDNKTGAAGARSYSDLFLAEAERATGGSDYLEDSYVKSIHPGRYQDAAARRNAAEATYNEFSNIPVAATKTSGTRSPASNEFKTSDTSTTSYDDSDFTSDPNVNLEKVVERYGQLAIDLQMTYGVPWEISFGQMWAESKVGADTILTPNSAAAMVWNQDRNYNWMGLTYSSADHYNVPGKFVSGGRKWTEYSSVENMILGYTIDFLRNGSYYREAFNYTSKDTFDLDQFIRKIGWPYVCGPNASSCSELESYYYPVVHSTIEKVRKIAKEKGWPTSEEVAQNIEDNGAMYPDLSAKAEYYEPSGSIYNSEGETYSAECKDSTEASNSYTESGSGGDALAKTAAGLAWPYMDTGQCTDANGNNVPYPAQKDACAKNPKPEYAQAIKDFNLKSADATACNVFVSASILASGVDPDYKETSSSGIITQLPSRPNIWEEVTDSIKSKSDLRPGDVFADNHHTQIYIGEYGEEYGDFASASWHDHVGYIQTRQTGSNVLYDEWNHEYFRVFRLKSSANTGGISSKISEDGLTYDQAIRYAKNYGANKNNSTTNAIGAAQWNFDAANCQGGGGSNCSSFSSFFIRKFTNLNPPATIQGSDIVDSLIAANPGLKATTTPTSPFSIFQSSPTHTGVLLGIDNGTFLVGHSSCKSTGWGEGNGLQGGGGSAFIDKSSGTLSDWWGVSTNSKIVDLSDHVDMNKLQDYLKNGE